MAKLFGGIFGRAERSAPVTLPTIVIDGETYDMEYVRYCIEQDRTISALEARLHEADDPQIIAEETLKTACRFYGGDWAGILDVDLDLDVWTPLWWYNAGPKDKTTNLFGEFQLCAQPRVCSLTGENPVYPRPNQPDISESWDGISNGA